MGSFSIWHWLVVLVIVLVIFGPGKLPDVFKQAGKGLKAFKDASEGKDDADADEEEEVRKEVRRRRDERRKQLAQKDDLDDDEAPAKGKSTRRSAEDEG
jgi:sec-independent protein translocase protein TatA